MIKISNNVAPKVYNNSAKLAVTENASVFDDYNEEKSKKRKKIMIGIGIGLAIGAACLITFDLRRQNSLIKKLIKKIALKTKLGQNIKSGIDFAKEAKDIPMETLKHGEKDIFAALKEKATSDGTKICKNIVEDKELLREGTKLMSDKFNENPLLIKELGEAKTAAETIKSAIELGGTGPTKIAQILSNETEIMSQLEHTAPDIATAIRSTKSQCSFSRTLEEAATFLEEAFPGKGYILEKELSAGSIGATYLAKKPDGTEIVIKMLKKGVSIESLRSEHKFFEKIIPKITDSTEKIESLRKMGDDLYKDWAGELDLFKSLEYNKIFSNGAKRYSVAQIREISQNGQCLVMDMAKGIQMSKLMEILKDYRINPTEFHAKYASLIEANPWLGNPEKVLNELSPTVLKAFDEQFLFIKKGTQSIMHGDPHTGNFFVKLNKKGKLCLEFIDTDNCVIRNASKIKEDLKMISNYFVGNEEKLAEYFINLCKCSAESKTDLTKKVATDIRNLLFGKRTNIRDIKTFLDNVKIILGKYGLIISGDTTSLKAQIQFLTVADEAARLSCGSLNVSTIVKDIPKAGYSMIKAGINPFGCVKDAIVYAIHNVANALGTSLQFLLA